MKEQIKEILSSLSVNSGGELNQKGIDKYVNDVLSIIPQPEVTDEGIRQKAVEYDDDCFESGYQDLTIQDHFIAGAKWMRRYKKNKAT